MRLFIAIPIPPAVSAALAGLLRRWEGLIPGVRGVRSDQFHVTLRFLGDVPAGDLPRVRDAFRRAVAGARSFELEPAGAGAFPDARAPRVLWVGIGRGRAPLEALARRLEDVFAAEGLAAEERGFHPHITLGRLKRPAVPSGPDPVGPAAAEAFPAFVATEAVLFRSELSPAGPEYIPVERCPFDPAGLAPSDEGREAP
jgi:2'-5' RNA ligase